MNKWTALALVLLAALLGGGFWVFSHQKQEVAPQAAALPTDAEGQDEMFETESDLADTDALLEGQDASGSEVAPDQAGGSDAPAQGSAAAAPGATSRVETIEDPDEGGETIEDPIVIEDRDGGQPAPQKAKATPGP